MRGYNCYVVIKKGHSSNGWLQLELQINWIPFKHLSNTLYIRNSCLQVLSWKIQYLLRNGWPQLLLWNKEKLKLNCSLRLNAVNYKKDIFFKSNYLESHPFLMSCYFTKILVHLPVIAAVCCFRVYKLNDPANIYLFKVNSRNTRKGYEISPKFTIKYNRKLFWCLYY